MHETPEDKLFRHLQRSSVSEVESAIVDYRRKSRLSLNDSTLTAILTHHNWTLREWNFRTLNMYVKVHDKIHQ